MVANGNKCEIINLHHDTLVHKPLKNSRQIGLVSIYHNFPVMSSLTNLFIVKLSLSFLCV